VRSAAARHRFWGAGAAAPGRRNPDFEVQMTARLVQEAAPDGVASPLGEHWERFWCLSELVEGFGKLPIEKVGSLGPILPPPSLSASQL